MVFVQGKGRRKLPRENARSYGQRENGIQLLLNGFHGNMIRCLDRCSKERFSSQEQWRMEREEGQTSDVAPLSPYTAGVFL